MNVQAAAMSIADTRFVVVFSGLELFRNSTEADMTIETLMPSFGGVPVVLMGQKDDDTPVYYGDPEIVELLRGVPVDEMPWKEYTVRG